MKRRNTAKEKENILYHEMLKSEKLSEELLEQMGKISAERTKIEELKESQAINTIIDGGKQIINGKKRKVFYVLTDKILGSGGQGEVRLAIRNFDQLQVAVKQFPFGNYLDRDQVQQTKQLAKLEGKLMKRLEHANIIKFYNQIITDNQATIVMEYAESNKNSLNTINRRQFIRVASIRISESIQVRESIESIYINVRRSKLHSFKEHIALRFKA